MGVVPFVAAFSYAILHSFGIIGITNKGFTLSHWKSVWMSGELITSLGYSVLISAFAVLLSVLGALGFVISQRNRSKKNEVSLMLYLPLAMPGIVLSFFLLQWMGKSGMLSRLAYKFGIIESVAEFPNLVNDNFAFGITVAFVGVVLPFFILLFQNIYHQESIDRLETLASSLGASSKQIWWTITTKVLLSKTWPVIMLYFIFLMGAYEIPLVLGQEHPQMLSVLIVRELQQYDLNRLSEGYVIAVVYTLLVSTLAVLVFTFSSQKNRYV